MKVCLINPPGFFSPTTFSYYRASPPIGLAYVASALRKASHEVTVVDASGEALRRYREWPTPTGKVFMYGLDEAEVLARVPGDVEWIGIANQFAHEVPYLRRLLPLLRSRFPGVHITLGGENATALAEEAIEIMGADSVVLGEGEATAVELLAALEARHPLHLVPGLVVKGQDGRPIRTPGRPRIEDLDSLSWPAWDLFPVENYLEQGQTGGVSRGRSLPIVTSRGCPYRCTFCSAPNMWGQRYRVRSPREVVREIEALVSTYRIENVDFYDLSPLLSHQWIEEFCRLLLEKRLGLTWQVPVGARDRHLGWQTLALMAEAGCRNVTYAPESGSERVLRAINKRNDIERMIGSIRAAQEVGLKVHCSIMLGLPGETLRDVLQTWVLLFRLAWARAHTVAVIEFVPYPGSEIFARLRRDGRLTLSDDYWFQALRRAGGATLSCNEAMGPKALAFFEVAMLLSFYGARYLLRPKDALSVLSNLLRRREETVIEQFIFSKLSTLRSLARSSEKHS